MGKGSDAGFDPTRLRLADRLKLAGEESSFSEHIDSVRSFLSAQPPSVHIPTPEPDQRSSDGEEAPKESVHTFCQIPCLQSSYLTADSIMSPMLVFPGQYMGVIHTSPARRRAPKVPCVQRLLPVEVMECLVKTSDNSFHFVGRVFETAATLAAGGTKLEDHVALVRREVLYTIVTRVFPASAIVGPCEVFYQRDAFQQWEKRMPSDRRFLCRYIVQEKNPASPSPGGRVANLTPLSLTKKRHVDSRIFGPQSQALPSDSAPPLPSSIREHYWLVMSELVEKRMGVRKSCERAECELHMPLDAFAACIEVLGIPQLKDGVVSVEVDDFDRLQRTVFKSFRTFPFRVLDPPSVKKRRYQMPQEFRRNDRAEARGPFRFELHTDQWPMRLTVSFTYVIRASGFGATPSLPLPPPPQPILLMNAPRKSKKSSSSKSSGSSSSRSSSASTKKKSSGTPVAKVLGELSCTLIEV